MRSKSKRILGSSIALLLLFTVLISIADTTKTIVSVQAAPPASYDFSFVWMTDTQKYVDSTKNPSLAWIYDNMTQWIVNNKDGAKIQYVVHTGDITNAAASLVEWQRADHSMRILDNANVPYGLLAGNHDEQDGLVNYNKYFNSTRFSGKPYYHSGSDANHYDLISSNGVNFVIVYLSYGTDATERSWASSIFQTYSDRLGILALHEYLATTGGGYSGDGSALNTEVVLPNNNVFLVMCGHNHNAQLNTKSSGSRTYYELLSDYQAIANGGNGYQKIFYFDIDQNKVHVDTYSSTLNKYGGTSYNYDEFDLTVQFNVQQKQVTFNTDPTSGTITADGVVKSDGSTGAYNLGQRVHVVANPPSGYSFQSWEVSAVSVDSTSSPDTYMTVSDNGWLKAHFTQNTYTLIVNVAGTGTVTKNPDQTAYHYSDLVQLTANPTAGWSFSGWSGGLTGNPTFVTMDSSKTVTATFTQNVYTLTVTVDGTGCSVTRDNPGPYHLNDVVQLTPVAASGWSFSSWTGDLGGSAVPGIITITGNKAVTATFSLVAPTVTATGAYHGARLSWNDVGALSYSIYYNTVNDPGTATQFATGVKGTTFDVIDLPSTAWGKTCFFWIAQVSAGGEAPKTSWGLGQTGPTDKIWAYKVEVTSVTVTEKFAGTISVNVQYRSRYLESGGITVGLRMGEYLGPGTAGNIPNTPLTLTASSSINLASFMSAGSFNFGSSSDQITSGSSYKAWIFLWNQLPSDPGHWESYSAKYEENPITIP